MTVLYLYERTGRLQSGGQILLPWLNARRGDGSRLGSTFFCNCAILKFVATSVAEAELGALFLNIKEGRVFRLTLEEFGHSQLPTPIHTDNEMVVGIINGTIKRQHSRMFEMQYFYCCDQVDKNYFKVIWTPGLKNLADYLSKQHVGAHHRAVWPIYLHYNNAPRALQCAPTPNERQEQKLTLGTLTGNKHSSPKIRNSTTPGCPQHATPTTAVSCRHITGLNGLRGCVERIGGWGATTPMLVTYTPILHITDYSVPQVSMLHTHVQTPHGTLVHIVSRA